MRRVLASVVPLLAGLLAIAPSAGATTVQPRVVGGGTATSADAPWQALVLPNGYLCGGSILDATHIVTAAHCVYDEDTYSVIAPSTVSVRVGSTNRTTGGQVKTVSAIAVDPDYSPETQTNDAAILTLSSAVTLSATVAAIDLTPVGWRPQITPTPDDLRLSGWGLTTARSPYEPVPSDGTIPTQLQVAKTVHATNQCLTIPEYQPYDDAALLCAGQAGLDACQGDSGGPLAYYDTGAAIWRLAGIVTGGAGCAWNGYPGYYARVSSPGLHDFLANRGAGATLSTPYFTRLPAVTGTPRPGQTLTCDPGAYDNAYKNEIAWTIDGAFVSDEDTFALLTEDVGHTIGCTVVAIGLRGSAEASATPVVVQGPVVSLPPAVTPTPGPPVAPTPPAHDTAAPTAHVQQIRCTGAVCVLSVKVADPLPTFGVKGVTASVKTSYRKTCTVKKRRTKCNKSITKRLKAKVTAPSYFLITTPHLHKGKQVFTLYGVDTVGHRQARPTMVTRTTR